MKLIKLKISNKYNFLFIFLFFSSIYFLFFNNEYYLIDIVKILLLFFLVLFPIFYYIINSSIDFPIIPYLQIFFLFFFVFYCFGFFLNPEFIFFDSLVNSNVINVLLLSILFFYLGYLLFNFFLKKKKIKIRFLKLEHNKQHLILYISLIYLFFFYLIKENNFFIYKYLIFLKNSFFFLLAVSLANYFDKQINKIKKIIFLFLFLSLLFIDASNSLIFNSFFVFSCFLFCLFILDQKKIFFILLLFSLISASILQTTKFFHRHIIAENLNENRNESFLFLNNIYINLNYLYNPQSLKDFTYFKKNESRIYRQRVIRGSVLRVFHSANVLSRVVKKTPEEVNFFYGKSYEGAIYKFIPRLIYPKKPSELYGNFWGRRYGGLVDADMNTSWNFPILSEFYANFGLKGCIVGMFVMGCFLRIISSPIINDKKNYEANLISISIFYQFMFQESNFTLLLGNLYISLIVTLSIIYICNKISKN